MGIHPQILQFVGSLIAIVLLAWLVKRLGMGKAPRLLDDEQARAAANEVVDGFEPVVIVRDKAGGSAILRDNHGQIMVLRQHGVHFAGRILTRKASAHLAGDQLLIDPGEPRFGEVSIELADAPTWVERINSLKSAPHA